MIRLPALSAAIQGLLLLVLTVVLIQPGTVPDPLRVGESLSWTALCVIASLPVLIAAARLRLPPTTVDVFVAVYLVCVVAVLPFSVDRLVSATWLMALIANIAVFYGVVHAARTFPSVSALVLTVVLIGGAVLQLMALEYHAEQGLLEITRVYDRPEGWNGYPELGLLACLEIAILLALAQTVNRISLRLAVALLMVITIVQLTFLYSRMAWLTALVVLLVAAISALSRNTVFRWGAGIAVLAAVLAFAIAQMDWSSTLRARLTEPSTVSGRIVIWQRTVTMIQDHAFTGVGFGNFQAVYEPVYNPELNPDVRRGGHAHNLWLQQAAEAGVLTAAANAILWIAVVVLGWRQRNASWMQRAAFLVVVAVAVRNLGDHMFFSTGGAPARLHTLTWIAFGMLGAGAAPVGKWR